jgi:glycosyltransferase involved in cell wall biosynthesis
MIPLGRSAVWFGQRVSVIVPCYREARLIGQTLSGIPQWVDHVCAVDDASDDNTVAAIRAVSDPRVEVVCHSENQGVGAAIVTGYLHSLARGADLLVVMAGDNQMDPADLPRLIEPVADGLAHYTKGNRFIHRERKRMPWNRRLGGQLLSLFTRLTTGLKISDSQCGFTVLSSHAARALPLCDLWPRFGYPNDILGMLSARKFQVKDVSVRPVYATEQSGIRFWHLLVVLWVILRRFVIERRNLPAHYRESAQHAK